jgi:hypothetical protein
LKNMSFFATAGMALALFAGSAAAATITISTGLDALQNPLGDGGCDAHWTVSGSAACGGGAAQVVLSSDADWYSGWAANTSSSQWITRNASVTPNGSPLPVFTLNFFLSDPTGASLTGSYSNDDGVIIALNGDTLATVGNTYALTSLGTVSTGFLSGWNSFTMTMTSSDNFLEGVRFEGTITGAGASFTGAGVPEPGTYSMLLAGVAGLWFGRRRLAR